MPQGANTILGGSDLQLSGGQMQRIGIARAIVREKPIILFDEITANLDPATSRENEKLIATMPNTLRITINHHLNDENKAYYDVVIDLSSVKYT